MKNYIKAPLPFCGQKRNQARNFREVLKEFDDNGVYIDAFGGSGLLSQIIRQIKPKARVIYNDFDNYIERLNHISETNELLGLIYEVVAPYERNKKISLDDKDKILNIISNFSGYKDFITLSSHLLFSGNYAKNQDELKKHSFYRPKITNRPIYDAKGYLDGVEIVRKNGFDLLKEYQNKECVLVLDPPYLQTFSEGYTRGFKLKDFLDMVFLIKEPYILFSSERSDILEFLEFASQHLHKNFATNFKIKASSLSVNGSNVINREALRDYLIYKA